MRREENQTAHDVIYHCQALRPPNTLDDLVPPGPEGVRLVGSTCRNRLRVAAHTKEAKQTDKLCQECNRITGEQLKWRRDETPAVTLNHNF